MINFNRYLLTAVFLFLSTNAFANNDTIATFGGYTVHYSIFNSTFITPEIAKIHSITRANNQSLVNISVTKNTEGTVSLGLPASVTGHVKNLIQQQRSLDFAEIKEPTATYYLAPVRHTNEEMMHFSVEIAPAGSNKSFTLTFDKKLYTAQP